VSRAQPTDRSIWPASGPHRRLLEVFDALREARRSRPSLRLISTGVSASHEAVRSWLTGSTLPSRHEVVALVAALGGGADQRDQALRAREMAESEFRERRASHKREQATAGRVPPSPGLLIVQNKIAAGSSELIEDATPVYLSSKKIPFAARHGCKVPGTEMWSGEMLRASYQSRGSRLTNYNLDSNVVRRNPHRCASDLWYFAELSDGTSGYLSEVYVVDECRGGMGLPSK
jgi:hypothetical protein